MHKITEAGLKKLVDKYMHFTKHLFDPDDTSSTRGILREDISGFYIQLIKFVERPNMENPSPRREEYTGENYRLQEQDQIRIQHGMGRRPYTRAYRIQFNEKDS